MFKSARWRSEKNKIKVVFKLQFHATQVAGDALMISVVPADVGKPTLKLEKAPVRDGSCYWEKAVLETVKFIQEPKSGKIHEKIYYFILGTGSLKSGVAGEALIDFSNYAEASKISSVSLPLKNSKSGALLHVSIQRIQDSSDQRVEEIEDAIPNSDNMILRTQLSNDDVEASLKGNSTEDGLINKPILHNGELNGIRRASGESDITMSSSGSSSGLDTPRQIKMRNNIGNQDHINFPLSPNDALILRKPSIDVSTIVSEEIQQSEWLGGSTLEASTDGSSSTPREALHRLASQEVSDIVVVKLKSELAAFARQVEVSDLELQTLRKQIVKESRRGQDLLKEVASLKNERDALKEECDKLKASLRRLNEAKSKDKLLYEQGDLQTLVSELRQELAYQKELNANLEIQLQKTQESNSELILAVRDLDEMLEQKNKQNVCFCNKSTTSCDAENLPDVVSKNDMIDEDDEDQKALEQLVREHSDVKDSYMLEQKIEDLCGEIEIYRRERDDLEMQMEQLVLDNEILKQENHDILYKLEQSEFQEQLKMQYECATSYSTVKELEGRITSLENELMEQAKELSDSLVTISELKAQVSTLDEELENQAQGFEADLETLSCDKVKQEHRAIRAEEELRKTRQHTASTAERLQDELKSLSMQMMCSLKANEKKALHEANELRLQKMHFEETLQKSSEELRSIRVYYEAKMLELSSQITDMSGQMEKLQLEIEAKSAQLEKQEEVAKETEHHLSQKIISLKAEFENLLADKNILHQHAEQKNMLIEELESTRKSIENMQLLVKKGHSERRELETRLDLVEKEAMETVKELNATRSIMDEKETLILELHLEVNILISECNEMKKSLFEDESEKENLRKQLSRLKEDLNKNEDALNSLEKKLMDSDSLKETIKLLECQIKLKESALDNAKDSFMKKEKDLQDKIEELERRLEELQQSTERFCEQKSLKVAMEDLNLTTTTGTEDENPSQTLSTESNNSCCSDEEMESTACNTRNLEELSNEMELLKERNKFMEVELKEMQGRYSEISLKFAEVEGERQKLAMKLRNIKSTKKELVK
ncbi:E3 ubiquitin-protein ligase BRE1-like 2 [Solanum pennellii]|uniref:E3 ubiquitin-protein ligase BRE1-like 2 n=1 Tax=Solanum pennellii TaxID=28526 RepID=A0ABM1HHF2_SOLPN|nr:E3 ubiquitin-protein ligase BRE1-like 2 [Solanum pennellii]